MWSFIDRITLIPLKSFHTWEDAYAWLVMHHRKAELKVIRHWS